MVKNRDLDINKLKLGQTYDEKAISDDFVEEHMGLVKSIASKILYSGKVPPCIDFDDLVSWGIEGLIKAKKSFNTSLKTKFQTYAYYRIKGSILDSVRHEWNYRMPQQYKDNKKRLQENLSQFIEDCVDETSGNEKSVVNSTLNSVSFVHYLSNEINNVVSESKGMKNPEVEKIDNSYDEIWDEINSLQDQEAEIIKLFYINGLKQKEIAKHLKLSTSTVCRIHLRVLEKLKNRLKKVCFNE